MEEDICSDENCPAHGGIIRSIRDLEQENENLKAKVHALEIRLETVRHEKEDWKEKYFALFYKHPDQQGTILGERMGRLHLEDEDVDRNPMQDGRGM